MNLSKRLLFPLLCLWLLVFPARAEEAPPLVLTFFWSLSCPHCTAAHPHIETLAGERPWLRLEALEVSKQPANAARFEQLMAQGNAGEQAGVPAFLFCGELHIGWESDATTGALLRQRLDACQARRVAGAALPANSAAAAAGVAGIADAAGAAATAGTAATAAMASPRINLPVIGSIDPAALSLPVLTLVLAGLDAFNPCAFFVLLFLLSMMAHQKSRPRMLLIGGVFVAISGLMYFAFMAAWLSVFQVFGHFDGVTRVAGVVAVIVGVLNLKDFIRFGVGPSLSIPAARKADIFRRARAVLSADALPAMLTATVVLAVAANFYELLCTAGFPMVYTRLLTLAELSPAARYGYLALYNTIYVLPLAAIVVLFARTLGARKLAEHEGRLLKLLSGTMMLGLGTLLLTAPDTLGQPLASLGLMLLAVAITAIAAWRLRAGVK